jgi:hypothetical protein
MKTTEAKANGVTYPVDEYIEANYNSLLGYCKSKWNGNGQAVLHEAAAMAMERYKRINFTLFEDLAKEAAERKVKVKRYKDYKDGWCVEEHEEEKVREKLARHNAVAEPDPDDAPYTSQLTRRERAAWYRKLAALQAQGYSEAEIVQMLTGVADSAKPALLRRAADPDFIEESGAEAEMKGRKNRQQSLFDVSTEKEAAQRTAR